MTDRPALWALILCLIIPLTSCELFKPKPPPKATMVLYEWSDDHGPGQVSVEIDLAQQLAVYKRGKRMIGWSFVSTGKKGHATRAGNYTISEKLPVKYSDRYGWISNPLGVISNADATPLSPVPLGEEYHPSAMNYWMRITHYGVGLHAGEISKPGTAASHGCVRLPKDLAPILYEVTRIGTPVKISPKTMPSPTPILLIHSLESPAGKITSQ
jgi:lipoprotein-anchoring transpeptidase ErfK/SrfK